MRTRLAGITLLLFAMWHCVALSQESKYIRRDTSNSTVIVFVHGVLGDSVSTWTNSSTRAYWPALLLNDSTFDGASVYVFQYPSPKIGVAQSINELAEVLRRRLEADGVLEHREMVLISHSMGGLVSRAFLLKYRQYAAQVRLAYFLSTPTEGSPSATLATLVSRNPQFKSMYPMQSDTYLADLQRDWLAARLPIRSFCAYEGRDTLGLRIVDQRSATNLCTEPLDPILEDHIGIAKPASRDSDSYLAFKNAFRATRREAVLPVPSAELMSLVSYYEARGARILGQFDATIADMPKSGQESVRIARSKVLAESKRAAFAEVFGRHIAAVKAGKLTLAAVFETEANEVLTGERGAYAIDPGLFDFKPTVTYQRSTSEPTGALSEYAEIMSDHSLTVGARRSAAVQIIRYCDGSDECMSALAAILTSPDTQYIHWDAAQDLLCSSKSNKARALPFVEKVLSDRKAYYDWRLWIFSMNVAGCIGKSAESVVPHIIDVIERTELEPNVYYNTPYIREKGIEALGKIGEGARLSVVTLKKLATGSDKELSESAKRSLRAIQDDASR